MLTNHLDTMYKYIGATLYSFGPSQNPFVLDGTSCSGTENSLLSCSSSYSVGVHHCHRGQESGVKCQGEWLMCTYNLPIHTSTANKEI